MSANQQGLYNKYKIEKADGLPIDPAAQYFVLRVDTDPHARTVLSIYADKISEDNNDLAREISAMILYHEDRIPDKVGPHTENGG